MLSVSPKRVNFMMDNDIVIRGRTASMQQRTAYAAAADSALEFLKARILSDEWTEDRHDVAYYFKAPRAFLLAGDVTSAQAAFDKLAGILFSKEPFVEGHPPSANPVYSGMYPHYPVMWAARVATELPSERHAADKCDELLKQWRASDGSGLVFSSQSGEGDLFATAMLVYNHLTFGRLNEAMRSADVLVQVVNDQTERSRFHLRWSIEDTATATGGFRPVQRSFLEPPASGAWPSLFYTVDQHSEGQLYFMLGFPAMVLLDLQAKLGAQGISPDSVVRRQYVETANSLLDFVESCNGYRQSPMAHKVAVAAKMSGRIGLADCVGDFFLSQQQQHGGFAEDADALDTVDQTAEMACWLRVLSTTNLTSCAVTVAPKSTRKTDPVSLPRKAYYYGFLPGKGV